MKNLMHPSINQLMMDYTAFAHKKSWTAVVGNQRCFEVTASSPSSPWRRIGRMPEVEWKLRELVLAESGLIWLVV